MSLQERACRDFNILHSVDGCEELSARFEFLALHFLHSLFLFFKENML